MPDQQSRILRRAFRTRSLRLYRLAMEAETIGDSIDAGDGV